MSFAKLFVLAAPLSATLLASTEMQTDSAKPQPVEVELPLCTAAVTLVIDQSSDAVASARCPGEGGWEVTPRQTGSE